MDDAEFLELHLTTEERRRGEEKRFRNGRALFFLLIGFVIGFCAGGLIFLQMP